MDRPPPSVIRRLPSARRLDSALRQVTVDFVKSIVSMSEGQKSFPALIKAAENGQVVTVTRHDKPVACVVACERMRAIAETLEIIGNAAAMQAIKEHKAGKTKFGRLDDTRYSRPSLSGG